MPLTDKQIIDIRWRRAAGESTVKLGKEFGVHSTMITKVALGQKLRRVRGGPIVDSREIVSNELRLEVRGVEMSATKWGKKLGINPEAIRNRLRQGWTAEAAVLTPISAREAPAIIRPIGPSIAYVPLSGRNDQYALIDSDSIPLLSGRFWHVITDLESGREYAHAMENIDGEVHCISMKHLIAGFSCEVVDAINENSLDCRLVNLRPATKAQSNWRRKKARNNTSGFIGIQYRKDKDRWLARCETNGVRHYLGSSKIKEEAARLYDQGIKRLRGEFARPNFEEAA